MGAGGTCLDPGTALRTLLDYCQCHLLAGMLLPERTGDTTLFLQRQESCCQSHFRVPFQSDYMKVRRDTSFHGFLHSFLDFSCLGSDRHLNTGPRLSLPRDYQKDGGDEAWKLACPGVAWSPFQCHSSNTQSDQSVLCSNDDASCPMLPGKL